ncbi:MAG TPA: SDR family NAD(P)-dependent oxidoreductase [Thermoleophilaceae bacterium]|jgi:NAD(P)-dependent dehydrogenase (short-subunit alcohol dehydrogenase family)|nr:SDR family NAD(P)-dependent oxidoreductase [Thermoleophilaceae bacterium]
MSGWLGLGGRRVVVAGGSGTIGAALVDGFRQAGSAVAVIDLEPADGNRFAFAADLRDPDAARQAITGAAQALGGLDVFVHCVGINNRKGIEDYSTQEWDDIVGINLSSAFHTAQAALGQMREQGHGRLIFFSSVAGRSGHKQHGPYAATKGAINQLTRVIAHEYAASGITANAVAPGYMETALTNEYLAQHPEKKEELVRLIPAQRFGRLQEVVDPVLFLASDRAGFINGQVLYIDGGRTVV